MVRGRQPGGRGRGRGQPNPNSTDAVGARIYTEEDRENALELLAANFTKAEVCQLLGVPRSTLARWVAQPDLVIGKGKAPTLKPWEENLICVCFNFMSDACFPLSPDHLLKAVGDYCAQAKGPNPFADCPLGRPGLKWLQAFQKRHANQLVVRQTEYLAQARGEALNPVNVKMYFDKLEVLFNQYPEWRKFKELIYNLDETALHCDETDAQAIITKGSKNAYKLIADACKLAFTLLVCVNAAGDHLPPFLLYNGQFIVF